MANVEQTKTPQWALDEIEKCRKQGGIKLDLSWIGRGTKPLTEVPKEVFQLTWLQKLNVSYNQLVELPEASTRLVNLQTLLVSGNRLTELPEAITRLTNLRELYITNNQLAELPEVITRLTNLTHLDVSDNQLAALPETITRLTNLRKLYITNNQLAGLPEGITRLTNLRELYITNNQLAELPEGITRLTNLISLAVRNNQLAALPKTISRLTNLQILDVRGNQLTALPEVIMRLTELQRMEVRGNPLQDPPLEIAEKGITAIREYFAQKRKQGEANLYEAKMMLLGEGGTGKTSLARKLQDIAAPLPKDEETTWGIDILTWSFLMKDGTPFRVNVWDFGGQQIYHQTHQFFLTHRSLYALLTDSRKGHTDFDYWLDSAQLFGGDSPLIIVSNEKEDRREDIQERELRGKFEQFKGILRTNLKDGRGLSELRNEIEHLLCALPHVGTSLPAGWVRVREALEKDPRNYIRQQEFIDLCTSNGIDRRENALQLSGYLRDLGVILHFQDKPELRNLVILKPEWATRAVYNLVQNKDVVRAGGRFTFDQLYEVWSDPQYEDKYHELIALMENFKLCYQISGQQSAFILPQLLPDNVPNYTPIAVPAVQLHYKYEFMPKGILAQLIVRMNTLIEVNTSDHSDRLERSERFEVWKTGVVLAKDGARAEVIEDRRERKIRVKVSGNTRNQLLSLIAYEIQEIHSSFRGQLNVDALIPCVCEECSQGDPHFFTYGDLIRRQKKGKPTIECNRSFEHVRVQEVLDGTPFDFVEPDEVKELLEKFFSVNELEELLHNFSNLPEIRRMGESLDLDTLGSREMGKGQLIIRLIAHCEHRGTLAALYRLARSKRKG